MPVRDCTVLAIEGTQASGKTTLVSHYREQGIHVSCIDETARLSPCIEEVALHGGGTFDLATELDSMPPSSGPPATTVCSSPTRQ